MLLEWVPLHRFPGPYHSQPLCSPTHLSRTQASKDIRTCCPCSSELCSWGLLYKTISMFPFHKEMFVNLIFKWTSLCVILCTFLMKQQTFQHHLKESLSSHQKSEDGLKTPSLQFIPQIPTMGCVCACAWRRETDRQQNNNTWEHNWEEGEKKRECHVGVQRKPPEETILEPTASVKRGRHANILEGSNPSPGERKCRSPEKGGSFMWEDRRQAGARTPLEQGQIMDGLNGHEKNLDL